MTGTTCPAIQQRGVLVLILVFIGCSSLLNPSYRYEDVGKKRAPDQSFFENGNDVFFATYPNPYQGMEVLWIASFAEGPVEMRIHDMSTDSVLAIYRFEPQETPLYPIVYRGDADRLVKCVVYVNGQPKCARLSAWINPLPHPQWGTTYSVEIPH